MQMKIVSIATKLGMAWKRYMKVNKIYLSLKFFDGKWCHLNTSLREWENGGVASVKVVGEVRFHLEHNKYNGTLFIIFLLLLEIWFLYLDFMNDHLKFCFTKIMWLL